MSNNNNNSSNNCANNGTNASGIPSYVFKYIHAYVERSNLQNITLYDEVQGLLETQRIALDRKLSAMDITPVHIEEEIRKCYVTAGTWDEFRKEGYFYALRGENPLIKDLIVDLIEGYIARYSYCGWLKDVFKEGNYNGVAETIEKVLDKAKKGYVGYMQIRYLRKLSGDILPALDVEKEDTGVQQSSVKLKWKASPAVFGSIIDELINKGYIERPTSSFNKDAAIYLQLFEIDTTPATLTKELSDRTNSLCADNRYKLTLPKVEQLK